MNNILVEVALPVYNEEKELEKSALKLYSFLKDTYGESKFKITIADNASIDKSIDVGKKLAKKYKSINYIRLDKKGRGRAIKKVWSESMASVVAYMDIDLSTDLNSFPHLVEAITKQNYDLAVGSRLLPSSKIFKRPLLREVLSRGLNVLIKIFFQTKFSDAQCGFKAIGGKVKNLLPKVLDNEWFFDSELLIVAEKCGFKVYEEPVVWVDNPGSTVRVMGTVMGDLKGLCRLFFTRPWNKIKIDL